MSNTFLGVISLYLFLLLFTFLVVAAMEATRVVEKHPTTNKTLNNMEGKKIIEETEPSMVAPFAPIFDN